MNEDINIDELIAELASRNLPVCYKAAYVIGELRGKKQVVSPPAPVTVADAAAAQDA